MSSSPPKGNKPNPVGQVMLLALLVGLPLAALNVSGHPPSKLLADIDGDPKRVEMCYEKTVCHEYSAARQDCATAGDFENCLRVKMGVKKFDIVGGCTNDGGVGWRSHPPEADIPDWLECAIRGVLPQ